MRKLLTVTLILVYAALIALLVFPAVVHARGIEKADPSMPMLLVCQNKADEMYFIRVPQSLRIFGVGLNGTPSCIVAADTNHNTHTLCATRDADKCLLVPADELTL